MAAAIDDFALCLVPPEGSYRHAAAVTPSDTVDLTNVSRAILIGVAGNVSVITAGGETVTLTGLLAGNVYLIAASRVRATSTTATSIVALW